MPDFESIEWVLPYIKDQLDAPLKKRTKQKIFILYAYNSSGKTRLSKLFNQQHKGDDLDNEQVLYYNAFTEDLFSWDNDHYVLKIVGRSRIFKTIEEQGLDRQIIDNFQRFTGSKIEPDLVFTRRHIKFRIHTGTDKDSGNIKISRGEESVFVWSIFYTILDATIDALNDKVEDRTTNHFDNIQYVVIDDPVSSMDDTRIITIALELAELISKSKKENQLKFLITTHHALFFNALFNARENSWDRKSYILFKSDAGKIHIKPQRDGSPFAYHHVIISEIEEAIKKNEIKKYHFNLFRALLEKTANFVGRRGWRNLLPESEERWKALIKSLDHYSHNSLSDLESKDLSENNKKDFKEAFQYFIQKFKWDTKENG